MTTSPLRIRTLASLLGICSVTACSGQDVADRGEVAIIVVNEASELVVVDMQDRFVAERLLSVPDYKDAFAVSPDSNMVYMTGLTSDSRRVLVAVDTRSLKTTWSEELRDLSKHSRIGDITIYGETGIATSLNGSRLLLANSSFNGIMGIAVLDLPTRDPVAFIGPLFIRPNGLLPLPPGPTVPSGGILAVGTRSRETLPITDWLFVIDAASLEIQDSVTVTPPADNFWPSLRQAVPTPDGRSIFLLARDSIHRYDLQLRNVVASTSSPSLGWLTILPDATGLYMTDPGDGRDSPGSGLLFAFDANLQRRDSIDLRLAAVDGVAPVTNWAAPSSCGGFVYVTAGTSSIGPLFGPQPGRLLIVDVVAQKLVDTLPLGAWAPRHLMVR